jgi:DNA-binding MarR family transcriptional regulator
MSGSLSVVAESTTSLLRGAFNTLNERAVARLAEYGHVTVRPVHGAVLGHLDADGTTVTALAQRARMTKQSMAELVRHLEENGYVERVADPADRRAKRVIPTEWGEAVNALLAQFAEETEAELAELLGRTRADRLRADLAKIAGTRS